MARIKRPVLLVWMNAVAEPPETEPAVVPETVMLLVPSCTMPDVKVRVPATVGAAPMVICGAVPKELLKVRLFTLVAAAMAVPVAWATVPLKV